MIWKVRQMWLWAVVLVAVPIIALLVISLTSKRPENLGVDDGKLAACPSSPNCVSTQADDPQHAIPPLTDGLGEDPLGRIRQIITSMPRCRVVTADEDYLHAEFTSKIFRFTDDVEFYFDKAAQTLHFRSASRVGHSDLGVNRRRMEEIRRRFVAAD